MKNLLTKLRYVPKRFAIAAAVVVAGTATALTFAWGPSRDTYTMASPAPKITFNSIIDNPNYGDERNFVIAKDASSADPSAWSDNVTVQPGKEYLVRLYVHNNAAANLNLVAENTRASVNVPTTTGKSVEINGFVSANNADPLKVWDQVTFNSTSDFNLAYIAGSAKYTNNIYPNGVALTDSLVTSTGSLLGYQQMDGNIPGCLQYSGYVTFRVKPQFAATPNFEVAKTVRVNGSTDTTFKENVSVNPGEKVDYQIYFKNTGETQLTNVTIRDQLPTGMTYVPGTTWLHNSEGTRQVADGITSGGLGIGGYLPGGNAYLKFTAQIAANDALPVCGMNTLKNIASANTDQGSKSDDATVTVTKTCLPQPAADCKAITPHLISRTQFSFDGEATVANGATVSKYTFVVKNSAGAVVKTVTVNSTALSVNSGTITLDTVGVYSVTLTVTTSLGDKTNANCATTVEVKPAPVVPVYTCNNVTVNQISRTQFTFVTDYTVTNATFVRVDYVVRNAAGAEIYRGPNSSYTQTTVGTYTVEAIVVVKVDGVEKTATSVNCKKTFEVKPEDKDIQVCRLSDKVIVTIKESAFDASKYSKNPDDCKPAPSYIHVCELATGNIISIKETDFDAVKYSKNLDDCKTIKVCELATYKVIDIKQKDFDSTKYSKDLATCEKIQVCELATSTVITIRKTEYDAVKHSNNLDDCKKIQVCRLSDKQVITIKESEFDSKKYSRNTEDCKVLETNQIRVCELSTKKIVTIKETDFDAAKFSKTLSDCDQPEIPVIANTGPEMILGGLLGSSALGLGVSSFVRSRSAVKSALLSR